METPKCNVIQLELKYCELCGGLWLRRQGADQVYCAACAEKPPEFSLGKRFRTRPRMPVNRTPGTQRQLAVVTMISGPRGKA
jgi:Zn-finger nucleic acid-binding protein